MDGCNSIHDESDPECVTMESSPENKKESLKITNVEEAEKSDSLENENPLRDSKEENKTSLKVPPDIKKDNSSNEISDKNSLDGESLSNHCDSPEKKEQEITNSVNEQKSEHPSSDSQLNGSINSSNESVYDSVDSNKGDTEENVSSNKLNQNKQLSKKRQLKVTKDSDSQDSSDSDIEMSSSLNDTDEKINGEGLGKKASDTIETKENSEIKISSSKPIDCEENDGTHNINITTDTVVTKESDSNDGKRQTIIVTETKSLAQVINNAVKKDKGGSQEGKPTLVIIETKSSEPASMSKSSSGTANTITVETGVGKSAATTLTPVSMNSLTLTPTNQSVKSIPSTSNYGNHISSVVSPMIEDGGMAVEVPSLVVPYLIEYPPSRTISEFLKMLPLDPEEIKEIEAASKLKANNFSSGSASTSSTNTPTPPNPIGRPRAADKWGQYFDSSLGKFFVDIGLNLAKEWVQTDLVKSQKRKAEKEGRQIQQDINLDNLIRNLGDTKEKNEPYHFTLKKCEYCSFKTESILVLKNHYNYPHIHHLDYKCNFCKFHTRVPQDIIFHVEAEHAVQAKLEKPSAFYQCPLCEFEDNSKAKVTKHSFKCQKKFIFEKNLAPSTEFDPPAKRPKVYPIIPPGMTMIPPSGKSYQSQQLAYKAKNALVRPKDGKVTMSNQSYRSSLGPQSILPVPTTMGNLLYRSGNVYPQQGSVSRSSSGVAQPPVFLPSNQSLMVNQMLSPSQYQSNQIYQVVNSAGQFVPVVASNFGQVNSPRFTILPTSNNNNSVSVQGPTPVALVPNIASSSSSRPVVMTGLSRSSQQMQAPKPNISITPVTKPSSVQQSRTRMSTPSTSLLNQRHGGQNSSSFVVCEICDGYIKDLEQLRTHMQWIHKVKIHPKMIFNRPPLNCQKCQFRFFTDQGLERHLLGAHGLVTSSMQENANKGQDSGRCTICGKVFQWKLLAHMSKDHNMILKPAHLSYKCTVCAATFGMYKLFETHVYQAHSTVAKRVLDAPDEKKNKTYPPGPASSKPAEARMSSPSPSLECTECGLPFNRPGNYYRHWEKVHLKPCNIQQCRIDKCLKCLSAFDGKTPWSPCEEIGEDVVILNRDSELKLSSLNTNITVKNFNSNDESFLKEEEEQKEDEDDTGLDMDVEMPDEADDSPISGEIEDEAEETALDMEVESHDPDISSPGSVQTDEEED